MPLYINENQALLLLDMESTMAAIRKIFLAQALDRVENIPRTRSKLLGNSLNITAASNFDTGRYAVKVYGAGNFHIHLYEAKGGLLAIFEADWMGQLRTGATNGLAAKAMARPHSRRVGLIGAGRQAVTQLMALEAVGLQEAVAVYSRSELRALDFCEKMSKRINSTMTLVKTPEDAVRDSDIVVTATTSNTPVFDPAALSFGTHINAMGANSIARIELEPSLVQKAALLVCDDVTQARSEAGEFISLGADFDWRRLKPLSKVLMNPEFSRTDQDITIFKSLGSGLEDLAVAELLYDRLHQC